jgi:hypothetical protein
MGRGASFNELFWPVLQQKQIHFIFTVFIVFIQQYKKSTTTTKFY